MFFVGDNEIVFNKPGKQFDAVIMSDCSQCPVHPQLKTVFHEYAKKQTDIVVKHGARPAFFMTWAYKDKPEMTGQLAEQYTIAGNDNDALVIPAGLRPRRSVNDPIWNYQVDKRHPTLLGTYLGACTIYSAVYKRSPIGNTYLAGIDPKIASFFTNNSLGNRSGVLWR